MSPPRPPLAQLRVWITRPAPAGEQSALQWRAAGAAADVVPLVELCARSLSKAELLSIAAWAHDATVLLTSANAARFLLDAVAADAQLAALLLRRPAACLGEATAAAARALGYRVARVASRATGVDLAAELAATGEAAPGQRLRGPTLPGQTLGGQTLGDQTPGDQTLGDRTLGGQTLRGQTLRGQSFLLPASDLHRPELEQALRAYGADVITMTVYHAVPLAWLPDGAISALRSRGVDAVALYSPSAVTGLLQAAAAADLDRAGLPAALVLGPTTAAAAKARGLQVVASPEAPGEDALIEAAARWWAQRK
jgi:uroporphyrinogen-III synthase